MADENLKKSIIRMIKAVDKSISLERNAEKFYTLAAVRTRNETGRAMFEWLARFERSHQSRLLKKRGELMGHSSITEPIPIDDSLELSEADAKAELRPDVTDIEVLKLAIGNERRAITFYERKITSSPDESVKAMFRSMAREEEKHIRILTDQLNHLQLDRIWGDMESLEKDIAEI
jgi:rubrerythrin